MSLEFWIKDVVMVIVSAAIGGFGTFVTLMRGKKAEELQREQDKVASEIDSQGVIRENWKAVTEELWKAVHAAQEDASRAHSRAREAEEKAEAAAQSARNAETRMNQLVGIVNRYRLILHEDVRPLINAATNMTEGGIKVSDRLVTALGEVKHYYQEQDYPIFPPGE